ncbi:MAG: hypothetical protein K5776_06715, partial [Lachnospiraceae bacterium]|nr:hypothetical protein [Lachnospiraceae bacterium]
MKKIKITQISLSMIVFALILLVIPLKASAATIWNTEKTLTSNLTVNGDLTVTKKLDINGYILTVNGNMIADADVVLGSYGQLIVKGNYTQKTNYLYMSYSGCVVDVSKSLKIEGIDANGNAVQGSGSIYSPSGSSVRNVGENYVINSTGYPGNGGTLNLKGNLIDKVGKSLDNTVINFNGTKEQTIDIVAGSDLGQLGGSNGNIKVKKYFNGELKRNFKLTSDEKELYINNDLNLNGFTLTIPVSVIADSDVMLGNNGKLTVKGNYTQKTEYLYMSYSGCVLDVSKNLKLEGIDANGNAVRGSGGLYGPSSSSVRNVGGNYVINTTGYPGDGGTLNLKGNLIDKVGKDIDYSTINFNGTKEQTIDIAAGSKLGKIGGSNENIKVKKYFNGTLQRNFKFTTDAKELYINKGLDLNGFALTIPVSVISNSDVMFGDNGKLTVKGNYTQITANLEMPYSGCVLDISKDLKLEGIDANGNAVQGSGGLYAPSGSSVRNIGGNYVINTTGYAGDGGTLNLKGNLIDKVGKDIGYTTINFNGTKEQTIDIAAGSTLGQLGGSNENIKVKKYFNGTLQKNFKLTTDEKKVYINNTLKLNSKSLTVPASVIAEADVYWGEGGKFVVKGDYIQKSEYIYMNYGANVLDISKSFKIEGIDANGKAVTGSGGFAWSPSDSTVINVGGNYIINTTSSNAGNGGTLNLKGSFNDRNGKYLSDQTVNFIGTKEQTINIVEKTELGKLGGSNENLKVKKYFNGRINSNFKVTSNSDDIIINNGLYVKGCKLTLDKNVVSGKYVEIGKSAKLTVNGNYTQTGSSLYFSDTGSALEVTGNLSVQGIDSNGKAVEGN